MRVTKEEKEILKEKYFQLILEASREYGWPSEVIAAMMSRESRCGILLKPRKPGGNPAGKGDYGHGHGLMQIDDRSHKEFINTGKWKDPRENIIYAMEVLKDFYAYLKKHSGLSGDDLRAAAIAGYNCGPGNVMESLEAGESWDAQTTGRDYSKDVLARSRELCSLFQEGELVPSPVTDTGQRFRVNAEGLNFRMEPEVTPDNVIAILKRGQVVTKVGEADEPKWWKVSATVTAEGFVSHGYLTPEKEEAEPIIITGIVAVHLRENRPQVTRSLDDLQAFPLGELNRPARRGTTPDAKVRELALIIDWLNVEESDRYQPNSRATYCNIYAYDYCYLAGAYLPRVWWTRSALANLAAGEEVPVRYEKTVTEVNANGLYAWLDEFGSQFGWEKAADLTDLQKAANAGAVAVICARRKDLNRSGHIVVVVPETEENRAFWRKDKVVKPLISQAGVNNHNYHRPKPWWLGKQYRSYGFWKHA